MKIFTLTCGAQVLLDDEDYERIPKTGWYLSDAYHGDNKRKTRYAVHDTYGKMHRYILNLSDPSKLVDHIDGNGLNNQKSNLRVVTSSINKKNQKPTRANKFNFNGISYEENLARNYRRIIVLWSEGEPEFKYNGYRAKQKKKSFALSKYNNDLNLALKDAILFRINKMRENGYLLDECSTTIENILLNNDNPDMQTILGINFDNIVSRVEESSSK